MLMFHARENVGILSLSLVLCFPHAVSSLPAMTDRLESIARQNGYVSSFVLRQRHFLFICTPRNLTAGLIGFCVHLIAIFVLFCM